MLVWGAVLGIAVTASIPATGDAAPPFRGDFQARIRANDAPTAGRLTIHAYMLDTLDAAVSLPGPGRVMAVEFTESNGKNSFVVPFDLVMKGDRNVLWTRGFRPLDPEGIAGALPKDEDRWALWWAPWGTEELLWKSIDDLRLVYGFSSSGFVPMNAKDARRVAAQLPWDRIADVDFSAPDPYGRAGHRFDPAAFDDQPVIKTQRAPVYPKTARIYDFEGTVNVAALVDETGEVVDAFVLQSSASHELNMAALMAAMDWTFTPGRKQGKPARGYVIIPLRFSLGTVK